MTAILGTNTAWIIAQMNAQLQTKKEVNSKFNSKGKK